MSAVDTDRIVIKAFLATHRGRSTDDVVIDDDLNHRFLAKCRERLPDATDFELNWRLLNLRKRSSLGPVASVRIRLTHDEYLHAAEIAARSLEDTYHVTVDRVLCDPERRAEFDRLAKRLAPDVSLYALRKAALKLRKGRQLRPELVKRVAGWNRCIMDFAANELLAKPAKIPSRPGVYLLYDKTGYLYIGEAQNLRTRVAKQLDHSDRKSLARYLWKEGVHELRVELHVFDPESEGRKKKCRRAYEADLIRNRAPRFNI